MKIQFNSILFIEIIDYIMEKSTHLKNVLCFLIFVGTFILFLSSHEVYSLKNPAMVYCTALGYNYSDVEIPEGQVGMCTFPDNTSANADNFLRGKEALQWSYCSKQGYEVKHVVDLEFCNISDECTVCVLSNGTEIEVTKLMGLSFEEGKCGDRICSIGENYLNCPQDCSSGSRDGYCDGLKDEKCDPDCTLQGTPEKDPDCLLSTTTTVIPVTSTTTTIPGGKPSSSIFIYITIIAVIVVAVAFLLMRIRIAR